tara:strand:- start:115 stop:1020 length:906 start_codon:yes stop_codon:yes gene_type:complete
MKILERYIKSLLIEMSRKDKIDHRENYNHPGLVRDALYTHWVFGNISEVGSDRLAEKCNSFDNLEKKKQYFLNITIETFKAVTKKIKMGEELSCNLIDPDRNVDVGSNYSGGGIDPWGYIGFILKPRVVTMAFDQNVGVDIKDVGGGRLRKQTKRPDYWISKGRDDHPWSDVSAREEYLSSRAQSIRKKFPLEDDEAYLKSFKSNPETRDFFTYNQSEFVIVPKDILGVIWLDGEFFFDDLMYDVFYGHEEELGQTCEELVEEKRNLEKGFVKEFCSANGIEFYESTGKTISDIPRTSRDL